MVDFNKHLVKAMELFVERKSLRVAYYLGIGAAYLFAIAAVLKAVAAVIAAF